MPSYSNSLRTDKPAYVSGETLTIIGNWIGQSTSRNINIHIYDASGKLFKSVFAPLTMGSFSYAIKLNFTDPSGEYKIVANPEDNDRRMECKIQFFAEKIGDTRVSMPIIRELKNFDPSNVKIESNRTISWTNDDTEFHTATSFSGVDGTPDGVFDTGLVPPAKNSTLTIDNTNNQQVICYFCKLHPAEIAVLLLNGVINEIGSEKLSMFDAIHRIIGEKERKKLDLLLRHFDPSIIDMIDYDDISIVKNRLLTVVFWDIKGFSKLARSLEAYPDQLDGYLREYSDIAIKLIHKHGGYLDKFIGDGVMAIFGLQHKDEDGSEPAKDAAAVAIEFRKLFGDLKTKWIHRWKKTVLKFDANHLALKCGIHTGLALFGNFGNERLDQLTAVGHTVNFANRLCEFGEEGGHIFVSSTTKNNIESMFDVISIGEQEIRSMGRHEVFDLIKLSEAQEMFIPFELGKGKIVEWNIPTEVARNEPARVYAKFFGSVSFGFLDVAIYDSNNADNWFPDPSSYDCNLDTGKLNFKNQEYSKEWAFSVTSGLQAGKCRVVIGMYEDTNRLPFKSRRMVAYDEKDIMLK